MTQLLLAVVAAGLVLLVVILLRARAQAARDQDEARRISEIANDAVLVADIVDGRLISANPAACKMLGYDHAELVSRKLPELYPKELVSKSAEVIADVWEKKGLVFSDLPFERKDGARVEVEVSANLLVIGGRPAMVLYARDIGERKRLEAQIGVLAQFPENNPFPVMRVDELGKVVYANPAAKGYFSAVGIPESDLEDLLPDGFAAKLPAVIDERRIVVEEPYERLGRNLTLTYRPLRGGREVFTTILDVTDRVRAERQLRDAQTQLVQSEKMAALGNLVAGVAHELNTPIAAVRSNAEMAQHALEIVRGAVERDNVAAVLEGKDKVIRSIHILREANQVTLNASERVSTIVKSLRNFARLDEADRKRVDLHEGLDSTLTLLRHELKQGVEVVKRYGSLPEVECFPNRLNQVFMNVLVNAVHAMEGGKGTITIETTLENGQAVIRFTDSGKGISPEHLPRIFDPGFTTKGVGVGTGLGLSICYRIVQDHKGTIDATSRVGQGTTFTLRLPVA